MPNNLGSEVSKLSNLITDMTIAGASEDEMRRAVKHSMVAMDYEKSAKDNGIAELMSKYQGARIAKVASRMLKDDRYTIREIADILDVSILEVNTVLAETES